MSNASAASYFEQYAVNYADWTRGSRAFGERLAVFDKLMDRFRPASGQHGICVDLGCGNAALGSRAAARGFEVIAIDGSEQMLALAKREQDARGPRGDARIHDFRHAQLPLDAGLVDELRGRVDLIIASSVLEYLNEADTGEVLGQCAQLLRPRGWALTSFPNRQAVYWRALRLIGDMRMLRGRTAGVQLRQWTPGQVRDLALARGLTLDSVEYFALPFQDHLGSFAPGRPVWLATLFLAVLSAAR